MALQKSLTLTDNFGEEIQFPNAYIRVETVTATKTQATAEVVICKNAGDKQLSNKFYSFQANLDSGANHIKQAYQFLKTLPEFSGATDC